MSEIHASLLSLTNWLQDFSESFILSRWVFLRALGVVYACAFISLAVQIRGLVGEQGILPLGDYLDDIRSRFGKRAWHLLPTVFWFKANDRTLLAVCGLGIVASFCLIVGFLELPSLIVLFISYLSLTVAGQDFLSFQWDILLIESGFLAILLALDSSPLMLFLMWWLIFRLMFESGAVKLSCGDETWRRLTSLEVHYQTQPLPNRLAWYCHWLPAPFHRFGVAMVLIVELLLPFFIVAPAPFRHAAAYGFLFLMLMIFITGNYNFFNLLTAALSCLLLNDEVWRELLPASLVSYASTPLSKPHPLAYGFFASLALFIVLISLPQAIEAALPNFRTPSWIRRLQRMLQSFHLINSYGLFRNMTLTRPEIVIEGSMDGVEWKAYEFRYKPGELDRPPPFVAPHQPRLDWQMWFAALSSFYRTFWFQSLVLRLFEGSPSVLRLLKSSPFPEPPRYIRALLHEYEFTSPTERKASGHWWKRKTLGPYAPVMMRRDSTDDEEPGR